MLNIDSNLLEHIQSVGTFDASACMSCGRCTAMCPADVAIMPRVLFRYAVFGAEEKLRASRDIISACLLCGKCEENCPSRVNITGNIRTLQRYLDNNAFPV